MFRQSRKRNGLGKRHVRHACSVAQGALGRATEMFGNVVILSNSVAQNKISKRLRECVLRKQHLCLSDWDKHAHGDHAVGEDVEASHRYMWENVLANACELAEAKVARVRSYFGHVAAHVLKVIQRSWEVLPRATPFAALAIPQDVYLLGSGFGIQSRLKTKKSKHQAKLHGCRK